MSKGGKSESSNTNGYLHSIKSNLPKAFPYLASLLLGWGFGQMSTLNNCTPWLIGIGFLLLAVYIISLDATQQHLLKIKYKKARDGLCILVCLIVFLAPFLWSQHYVKEQQAILAKTPIFYGVITPDNKPNPVPSTGLPLDTMTLMLGDNLSIKAMKADSYILSRNGTTFLEIGIDSNGNMLLTTEVRNNSNDNIVKVIDNEFQANPSYAFNPVQPNQHSLVVRDSNGDEVLNIYFINPKVIRVTGTFYVEGYKEPIRILPIGGVTWDNHSIAGQTLEYIGGVVIIHFK
jgi:hypothetical protein